MTTTPDLPDFRAVLERLLHDFIEGKMLDGALADASAALATPPPEPPTDEELYDYWISTSPQFGCADPVGFARAVLERWGHR